MNDILQLGFHFVRPVSLFLVLAIVVLSGRRDNYVNGKNWHAAAFCSQSNSNTSTNNICNIGRRIPRRDPSISAGRGSSSINEYVSYLEEEFNRNNNIDTNTTNRVNNNNDDALPPIPQQQQQQRPYPTPVTTYTNIIDLLNQIDTAPSNSITVVLYFAYYCKTCQRAFVPFKQLANEYHDHDSSWSVHFVRLETSALSPRQFTSLGIDRVPYLQIYRNAICVASVSATQKISRTYRQLVLRPRVRELLDVCRGRSLADWLVFRDCHDGDIEANKVARVMIRESVGVGYGGVRDNGDDDGDETERLYQSVRTLTSESQLLRLIRNNDVFSNQQQTNDDFNDERGLGEENNSVVIMFHSHFDPSCHRAQQKFRKITDERCLRQQKQQNQQNHQTTTSSCTIMARIESSILSDTTLQLLGIQRYPHIQIYRKKSTTTTTTNNNNNNNQCVASFSIPRSFVFSKMLHESLDIIEQRTPEEWTEFYKQHREEMEFQQLALDGIVCRTQE